MARMTKIAAAAMAPIANMNSTIESTPNPPKAIGYISLSI